MRLKHCVLCAAPWLRDTKQRYTTLAEILGDKNIMKILQQMLALECGAAQVDGRIKRHRKVDTILKSMNWHLAEFTRNEKQERKSKQRNLLGMFGTNSTSPIYCIGQFIPFKKEK